VTQAPTAEVGVWLRSADQAVLTAKDGGGNCVVAFTVEMRIREEVRVAVEMSLLSAIRDGTLAIHFQPFVDMRDRSASGAEALLRWHHPTLGPVPPDLFVGVAEATNLAGELGRWVLDGACRQLAAWRADHPEAITADFTMAVNVSPVQLLAIDFVDTVAEVLASYDLEGRDLVLEVTEHAVVGDVDAAATLRGLRRLGVCVAIDDFGTGYSSLAQLKALPVNPQDRPRLRPGPRQDHRGPLHRPLDRRPRRLVRSRPHRRGRGDRDRGRDVAGDGLHHGAGVPVLPAPARRGLRAVDHRAGRAPGAQRPLSALTPAAAPPRRADLVEELTLLVTRYLEGPPEGPVP
jgi:hypothetical protein